MILIDVKCRPSHVYSENGFSNKKLKERNACVVCIRDFVETKKKTNAIGGAAVPIHFCGRHQSSPKPSVPRGKASFEVPCSPLSSPELMSISVFFYFCKMWVIALDMWSRHDRYQTDPEPAFIKHPRIRLVIWNLFARPWLLLFDVWLDILVLPLQRFSGRHCFALTSKDLVDLVWVYGKCHK